VVFAVWLFVSWFFWFLLFVWCCNLVPSGGRFVLAEYTFRDSVFRIACCYAPNHNPGRDAFLHCCIDSIDLVLDRVVARRGSCPFDTSRESSILLSALLRDCCVVDIWRLKHPDAPGFTWSRRDGFLASCVDLVGSPLFLQQTYCLALTLTTLLSWSPASASSTGAVVWKLNTSILEEEDYFKLISDFCFSRWQRRQHFSSLLF